MWIDGWNYFYILQFWLSKKHLNRWPFQFFFLSQWHKKGMEVGSRECLLFWEHDLEEPVLSFSGSQESQEWALLGPFQFQNPLNWERCSWHGHIWRREASFPDHSVLWSHPPVLKHTHSLHSLRSKTLILWSLYRPQSQNRTVVVFIGHVLCWNTI